MALRKDICCRVGCIDKCNYAGRPPERKAGDLRRLEDLQRARTDELVQDAWNSIRSSHTREFAPSSGEPSPVFDPSAVKPPGGKYSLKSKVQPEEIQGWAACTNSSPSKDTSIKTGRKFKAPWSWRSSLLPTRTCSISTCSTPNFTGIGPQVDEEEEGEEDIFDSVSSMAVEPGSEGSNSSNSSNKSVCRMIALAFYSSSSSTISLFSRSSSSGRAPRSLEELRTARNNEVIRDAMVGTTWGSSRPSGRAGYQRSKSAGRIPSRLSTSSPSSSTPRLYGKSADRKPSKLSTASLTSSTQGRVMPWESHASPKLSEHQELDDALLQVEEVKKLLASARYLDDGDSKATIREDLLAAMDRIDKCLTAGSRSQTF